MIRPVPLIAAAVAGLTPQALDAPPFPPAIRVAAVHADRDRFEDDRHCPNTQNALRIEGAAIPDASALLALRRSHPDRPIIVRDGDLSGGGFAGARLHDLCFIGTKLMGSDWRNADAPRLGLIFADLSGATLIGARMPAARIQQPHLKGVDASGADLSGGLISGHWSGSWEDLRLDGADLRGLRFDCSRTEDGDHCVPRGNRVSFRNADLRGASIFAFPGDGDWSGARFADTEIELRQLPAIAAARFDGDLIVRSGKNRARLSPAEVAALRPHLQEPPSSASTRRLDGGGHVFALPAGRTAYFLAPTVALGDGAPERLRRHLLPVVVAAAVSDLAVTAEADGSLSVRGTGTGAHAHQCTIDARGLRFDHRTGWYTAPPAAKLEAPGAKLPRTVPLLRFRGDSVEILDGGQEIDTWMAGFVTCGARAGFEPMRRLAMPASQWRPAAEARWTAMGHSDWIAPAPAAR